MADRATQNLHQNITHAHNQLKRARQDGGCEAILYWAKRVDELIDRLPQRQETH